jgi:hypothetical protein
VCGLRPVHFWREQQLLKGRKKPEGLPQMNTYSQSLLLFLLNWLDAQLTIVWVNNKLATEGNALMAKLLSLGDGSFLCTKICVGALAALVLYKWSHLWVAQKGLRLALGAYLSLMIVHLATSLSAW